MINNNQHIDHEFKVLDFRVKFKETEDKLLNAAHVVELVHLEAQILKEKMPHLSNGEVLLLVALKFAEEKTAIEDEYKVNVNDLHKKAKTALDLIEKITPTVN